MRRMRSRMFAAISGLPRRRRDFLVQCQAKALRCQRDRVGLNQVQTSPSTGPDSQQHNPQEAVAEEEAQAARHVVLQKRNLVTKGEERRLQGGSGPNTGCVK